MLAVDSDRPRAGRGRICAQVVPSWLCTDGLGGLQMVNHILVGVDGSEGSHKAARFAKDLASQVGARLTLLFVIEPPRVIAVGPMDSFLEFPRSSPEEIEAAHKLLDEVVGSLPADRI